MFLKDLLVKKSGIFQTTIHDICSGKTRLEKSSDETVYIPQTFSFDVFKSYICHLVKDKGDIQFLIDILEKDEIRDFYNKKLYLEAFYLLGMVDYLSRENNIPICTAYSDLRCQKLSQPIYPLGVIIYDGVMKKNTKQESVKKAIPEFLKFNIIESEVRNVY